MTRRSLLWVLLVVGCSSGGGEQQVIKKYFDSARLRDSLTLANIATVSFEPTRDGIVQSFEVTNVGAENRRGLKIRDLAKEHDDARKAEAEFSKRKQVYQDANLDAIDRVLKAERANKKLSGRDADVQAAWTKWREEAAQHSKRLTEARRALSDERGVAEISVFDARTPIDITQFGGELVSKDVTIAAQVRTPDGQVVEKTMVVTMQRAELKGEKTLTGRWIITDLKDSGAPAAKTS